MRNYLKILWKLVELKHQEDLLPVKGLSFEEIYFQPNDFSDDLKLKILLLFFKNAKVNLITCHMCYMLQQPYYVGYHKIKHFACHRDFFVHEITRIKHTQNSLYPGIKHFQ